MNPVTQAIAKKLHVAVAESLTAGLVAANLAETPGASKTLLGAIVSYQDEVKSKMLGVDNQLISQHTAVNAQVAMQMASGVRKQFAEACELSVDTVIGVSTTGVAGPDPVGESSAGVVFVGVSSSRGERFVALQLDGDRSEVRSEAAAAAVKELGEEIQLL